LDYVQRPRLEELGPTYAQATRAAPPKWLRGPARIEDGVVVLDRERAKEYWPLDVPDLAFDLAAVTNQADILRIVRRYGLLRHGPEASQLRETVGSFLNEASRLALVLDLYGLLRRAAEGNKTATEALRARMEGVAGVRRMIVDIRPSTGRSLHPPTTTSAMLEQANLAITFFLNVGLEDVRERVTPASTWYVVDSEDANEPPPSPAEFFLTPMPPDLLGHAYHQLALMVATRAPVRTCDECGRVFTIRDRRQRFCTTTCAGRARYRRFVNRKQKEGRDA
jgi:hypothetical protein